MTDIQELILKRIRKVASDFYITGSLSMVAQGILTRKVNDIDIVFFESDAFLKLHKEHMGQEFISVLGSSEFLAESVKKNDNIKDNINIESLTAYKQTLDSFRLELFGVKVCVFLRDRSTYNNTFTKEGWDYLDSSYSVSKKKEFIAKIVSKNAITNDEFKIIDKHLADLKIYNNWSPDGLPF